MQRAFGTEVLFTKEGGSGPEADLADILGAPLVFVAVGLDADRIHAPNEYVDLSRLLLRRGVDRLPVGRTRRRWRGSMSVPAEVDGSDAGPLGRLALSRSAVDRATQRRSDAEWIEAAWADPRTRVVVVHASQALGRTDRRPAGAGVRLRRRGPGGHPVLPRGRRRRGRLLRRQRGGRGRRRGPGQSEPDAKPISLRLAGALLSDRDAGLLTHAVALANWHDTHTHCPQCGAATVPAPAGHLTVCPVDGTEHFPRLDPAVIMLVTDPDDRCLLARNALWPKGRMSVLAGFVEPGESAEHAVVREVFEETAIVVGQVRYLGSQPWPMPRSLMLGYQAVAAAGQSIAVDEEEIGEARWFTRAEMRAAIDAGELGVAPVVLDRPTADRVLVRGGASRRSGSWATAAR